MVIALPANHRLAGSDRLPLSALTDEAFILFPREAAPTPYDVILAACHRNGFVPHIAQEVTPMASIIVLVAAHLGVSIVPKAMTQIKMEGVTYCAIEGQAPQM